MGRDQRNRRRGVVMRHSANPAPDPDYWKKRAMHFEQALLAAVASCPDQQLEVPNQDLTGMILDAEELVSENGERRGVRFKVAEPKKVVIS